MTLICVCVVLNLIHDFDYDDYGYDCGYVGCVDYDGYDGYADAVDLHFYHD